ncbi:MAG: hypothetical protein HYU54_08230 [Actinobacteria bacterium]|nr:hypothetical protein [Actinomycetota bacterium]
MRRLFILASAVALVASACGGSRGEVTDLTGGATAGAQEEVAVELLDGSTVDVLMDDFAFSPSAFTVKAGSTVTFSFTNEGAAAHEGLIGDEGGIAEHMSEMSGMAEMSEPEKEASEEPMAGVDVQPGETATFEYAFDEPGKLILGCLYPGHYEAGMKATITVVA